ncbi:MAG: methyl-accepting chemotaxis protein [Bryobacteraceae bacterium]|jgi:methyl-accepting chemotaxis protein/methyl-accepting chemotaxis protein-1 (serine sensor receptor)
MKAMTIGKKISLACMGLVVLTIVQASVSALYIGHMNTEVHSLAQGALPGLYSLGLMHGYEKEQKVAMIAHLAADTADEKSKLEATIADLEGKFQAEMKVYEKTIQTAGSRDLIAQLAVARDRVNREWEAELLPLSRALRTREAMAVWNGAALVPFQERSGIFKEVIEDRNNQGEDAGKSAIATGQSAQIGLLLILLFSVASGGVAAFFIIRGINRALTHAAADLSEGAEQVSSAAGQVSSSSQSLAQGASEQAASLEETSASSEEMSSMTRKNSENSQQAAQFMNAVNQRVVEANRTLGDMMTSMQEIGASSGKISKIIRVIDEIAFQTNILALNAAVEAARAGEAGMGFAVVADEVRNLAQRSAQAAKDTAALIEESILKSADGSTKLGEVAASIQAITEGAGKVKILVDEVEASSKEQAQGIQQISKAVSQMDEVTQRTAASAEESASASEELNAQSQALVAVVEQLQTMVGAASVHSAGFAKPASKVPVRNNRRPGVAAASARTPAPVAARGRTPVEIPLDDSEFREF